MILDITINYYADPEIAKSIPYLVNATVTRDDNPEPTWLPFERGWPQAFAFFREQDWSNITKVFVRTIPTSLANISYTVN